MRGVNKVILVGNCGGDAETRYMPNGNAVTNVTLATSEAWKDKQTGQQQERTEWHRVVFFGRLAEIAGEYLRKGSQVYVEGQLRTRKWQGQDGKDNYTTEIVVDINGTMQLLGGKPSGDGAQRPQQRQQRPEPQSQQAESQQQALKAQQQAELDTLKEQQETERTRMQLEFDQWKTLQDNQTKILVAEIQAHTSMSNAQTSAASKGEPNGNA